MTTLANALGATAGERLKQCARRALSNRNWDKAKNEFFKTVRNDASLLCALFEPYRLTAVHKLLTEVSAEMRASEKTEGGRTSPDNQSDDAPLSQTNGKQSQAAKPSGSGLGHYENPVTAARPALPVLGRVRPPIRDRWEGIAAVSAVAKLSMLDLFKINKQPIGDLTPREATAWAGSQERQTRFVRLITRNLPHDLPIRKFITPEEADALYERAGEMSDV